MTLEYGKLVAAFETKALTSQRAPKTRGTVSLMLSAWYATASPAALLNQRREGASLRRCL